MFIKFLQRSDLFNNDPQRGSDLFNVLINLFRDQTFQEQFLQWIRSVTCFQSIPLEIRSVYQQSLHRIRSFPCSFNLVRDQICSSTIPTEDQICVMFIQFNPFRDQICSSKIPTEDQICFMFIQFNPFRDQICSSKIPTEDQICRMFSINPFRDQICSSTIPSEDQICFMFIQFNVFRDQICSSTIRSVTCFQSIPLEIKPFKNNSYKCDVCKPYVKNSFAQ